ncbi:MAG: transposase, partial [Desulfurococcaceae archaeon]|nr:transposase [Desulfurococcaceae archaeon]
MFTEYKAVFHGIKTVYVNPAKTSRRPPNGKKLKLINYRFTMLGDTVTSRDVVASWNTALRGLEKLKQMRSSRVTLSPDNPRSEAMKTRAKRGNPEARNT